MIKLSIVALLVLQVHFFIILDKSNVQALWSPKNVHQPKYSNRKTYIDDVQRLSKKANSPSPDKYILSMQWPK
jgi:hypothetical protein